ncbi:hypothetical protein [Laceyella putida]|uniref:Lipoprotein n=1 Tax=Laceyella putida TaxID=110101 RepID=A0ABW2RHI2_9BACL
MKKKFIISLALVSALTAGCKGKEEFVAFGQAVDANHMSQCLAEHGIKYHVKGNDQI